MCMEKVLSLLNRTIPVRQSGFVICIIYAYLYVVVFGQSIYMFYLELLEAFFCIILANGLTLV